jgi:hypothetical protein
MKQVKILIALFTFMFTAVVSALAQDIYHIDPHDQPDYSGPSIPLPINYGYDASGNRTSKGVLVNPGDTTIIGPGGPVTLSVGPSPTQGTVTVSLSSWNSDNTYSVNIYGLSGQRVTCKESNSVVTTLDISSQADGVYIVEVDLGERKEAVKIIKER